MLDQIALAHYGDRPGAVEAILEANPGLAERGPLLPSGVTVVLPALGDTQHRKEVRLWD